MKDKKMTKLERIKEYDRLMKILYDELAIAINNPAQKHYHVGIQYVRNYQETIKFIKDYPKWYHEQYDLSLLNKEIKDLSESDLENWQVKITEVRGSLSGIEKEISD